MRPRSTGYFHVMFKVKCEMKFIEKIEYIFDVTRRGCVIIPGVPYSFEPPVNIGSIIEIHNPDGTVIKTRIVRFEMINRGRLMEYVPFSIPKSVKKSDISIGADIYLVENASKT